MELGFRPSVRDCKAMSPFHHAGRLAPTPHPPMHTKELSLPPSKLSAQEVAVLPLSAQHHLSREQTSDSWQLTRGCHPSSLPLMATPPWSLEHEWGHEPANFAYNPLQLHFFIFQES